MGFVIRRQTPDSSSPVDLYDPVERAPYTFADVDSLVICNHTKNTVLFSVFIDNTDQIHDETTAVYYRQRISGKKTIAIIDPHWYLREPGAHVTVQSYTASALTFTLFAEFKN